MDPCGLFSNRPPAQLAPQSFQISRVLAAEVNQVDRSSVGIILMFCSG